jgi:hypothetical protein
MAVAMVIRVAAPLALAIAKAVETVGAMAPKMATEAASALALAGARGIISSLPS